MVIIFCVLLTVVQDLVVCIGGFSFFNGYHLPLYFMDVL